MKRRTFNRLAAAGLAAIPTTALPADLYRDPYYTLDELMGIADIPLEGKDFRLRKAAFEALERMKSAAYRDGFDLKVVSAYRSYERQKTIWERKYFRYTVDQEMSGPEAARKIVEYSTIPGTSRHHWGTEVDIIDGYPRAEGDVLVPSKFEGEGPYAPFKQWLDEHAESFGFYLVYTNNPRRRGFKYEPWHYSYAALSVPMLKQFRKKNILRSLRAADFEGASELTVGFLKEYIHDHILDINPSLL